MPALVAVNADEAVREDAAAEVAAKLVLHLAGERRVVGLARVREEYLPLGHPRRATTPSTPLQPARGAPRVRSAEARGP